MRPRSRRVDGDDVRTYLGYVGQAVLFFVGVAALVIFAVLIIDAFAEAGTSTHPGMEYCVAAGAVLVWLYGLALTITNVLESDADLLIDILCNWRDDRRARRATRSDRP